MKIVIFLSKMSSLSFILKVHTKFFFFFFSSVEMYSLASHAMMWNLEKFHNEKPYGHKFILK